MPNKQDIRLTPPSTPTQDTTRHRKITFDGTKIDFPMVQTICEALKDIGCTDISITLSMYNNLCIEYNPKGRIDVDG